MEAVLIPFFFQERKRQQKLGAPWLVLSLPQYPQV
jgi:hypothetical protein